MVVRDYFNQIITRTDKLWQECSIDDGTHQVHHFLAVVQVADKQPFIFISGRIPNLENLPLEKKTCLLYLQGRKIVLGFHSSFCHGLGYSDKHNLFHDNIACLEMWFPTSQDSRYFTVRLEKNARTVIGLTCLLYLHSCLPEGAQKCDYELNAFCCGNESWPGLESFHKILEKSIGQFQRNLKFFNFQWKNPIFDN